jgi:hypothetical protein
MIAAIEQGGDMDGEQINAKGGNRLPDEPSVLHTKINEFWHDPELHAKLTAKSAEYDLREEPYRYTAPGLRKIQQGPSMYRAIFKDSILRLLLEIAEDNTRDFEARPVLMPEVAIEVSERTGLMVSRAATFPFIHDDDALLYTPDFRRLSEEATLEEYMFSEAYAIIQQYCQGSTWGVESGTGLPQLAEPTES